METRYARSGDVNIAYQIIGSAASSAAYYESGIADDLERAQPSLDVAERGPIWKVGSCPQRLAMT